MIILSFQEWDVGVRGSWVVGVSVVESFEFYSIHFCDCQKILILSDCRSPHVRNMELFVNKLALN